MAWYTESVVDDVTYYDVTIGSDGGVVANVNSQNLFFAIGYGINDNVSIDGLENLDTSLVTNMSSMFQYCKNSTNLDVSHFNTSNVTNMKNMFFGCNNLTNLDVRNFNTGKVTSYFSMFTCVPNNALIYVSTEEMKAWVLDKKSSFTNVQVVT